MSSFNKSKFFRIVQAKKRRAQNEAKEGNSISNYFSKKPKMEIESKPKRNLQSEDDLKKKLEEFKKNEADVEAESALKKLKLSLSTIESTVNDEAEILSEKDVEKLKNPAKKLTPLELQVKTLMDKYPGTLLMVECGYRYRFFGRDAERAAKILDIIAHPDSTGSGLLGLTASVPTHQGHVNYVRKMVLHGEKVGIVSQTESSAEKKVAAKPSSSGAPFARDLTELYTASTFLEDLYDDRSRTFSIVAASKSSCLSLTPSLGRVVLAQCKDNSLRDVLNNIEPFEIVCEENQDAIDQYVHDQRLFRDNPVRLDLISIDESDEITDLVMNQNETDLNLRQAWPGLNRDDIKAFQLMHCYLKQFGLEKLLTQSTFEQDACQGLVSSSIMKLPQMTIDGLELADVLKVVNQAKTKPGKRLFNVWLYNPITVQSQLEQRLDVVEFFVTNPALLKQIKHVTSKYSFDFEVLLSSALNQRISVDKFKLLLRTLRCIADFLASNFAPIEKLPSLLETVLNEIVNNFSKVPSDLLTPLQDGDIVRSKETEKLQEEISDLIEQLSNHKAEIAKTLGLLSFQYTNVSGQDFLIEVKNGASVPSNWSKISATQKVGRYRTPFIIGVLPKIQWAKEQLQQEAKKSWREYLARNVLQIKSLMKTTKVWATLDVLIGMSTLAQNDGFSRPKFSTEGVFTATDSFNILVKESLTTKPGCQFVPNDIDLHKGRSLILTGPNMGGKSCYLRQVGVLAVLAQMGSFVPAQEAVVPIFDALFVRVGAKDEIQHGKSTLFVELEEASLVLNTATENSLVLLDELGRGTATFDGTAIAKSVLEHLLAKIKCVTLFITHFKCLASIFEGNLGISSAHMGFVGDENGQEEDVLFLYKLCSGTAPTSFGINVAKMAGIPPSVLERAQDVANFYQLFCEIPPK